MAPFLLIPKVYEEVIYINLLNKVLSLNLVGRLFLEYNIVDLHVNTAQGRGRTPSRLQL